MITGEESKVTPVLKNAVDTAVLGGSRKVSEENRKKAIKGDIKLLKFHQEAGHQTLEEYERSLITIQAIESEQRRFNMARGYVSHADLNS